MNHKDETQDTQAEAAVYSPLLSHNLPAAVVSDGSCEFVEVTTQFHYGSEHPVVRHRYWLPEQLLGSEAELILSRQTRLLAGMTDFRDRNDQLKALLQGRISLMNPETEQPYPLEEVQDLLLAIFTQPKKQKQLIRGIRRRGYATELFDHIQSKAEVLFPYPRDSRTAVGWL